MSNKLMAFIFGVGAMFHLYKEQLTNDFDVIGIIDNNPQKIGSIVDGFVVADAGVLLRKEFDIVCVTANFYNSYKIRKQLENMGIPVNKMRFSVPNGVAPYRIPPDFFMKDISCFEKRRLFSDNIERVIIEINSKCNRNCWFCPNSVVDRHSKNIEMTDKLFEKIVDELISIEYKKDILLSYFNEPLCSEKILKRIKMLKESLPHSFVYLFTNGDYLTQTTLHDLSNAGLDLMDVDVYLGSNPDMYSKETAITNALGMMKKLNLTLDRKVVEPIIARSYIGNMSIEFISQDFSTTASNRAEALLDVAEIPKITKHNKACIKNFISFHIAYNGNVYPCPNMHTDIKKHDEFCLGNINDETIFDVYTGINITEFRKRNLFERDSLPCRSCIWDFESFVNNRYSRNFRDRPGD